MGLLDRADALPRELSGGEQQRIALCAALAHRPQLVIADEPTGDLDAESRTRGSRAAGRARPRSTGSAAVLVSHDPRLDRRSPTASSTSGTAASARSARASSRRRSSAPAAGCGFPRRRCARRASTTARGSSPATGRSSCIPVDGRVAAPAARARRGSRARAARSLEARGVSRRYGAQVALDDARRDVPPRASSRSSSARRARASRRCSRSSPAWTFRTRARSGWATRSCRRSTARRARALRRESHRRRRPGAGALGIPRPRARTSSSALALRGVDAERRARSRSGRARGGRSRARTPSAASTSSRPVSASASRSRASFAARTPVVIADEPTSRLDASTTLEIGALLAELAHDDGNDGRVRDARPAPHRPRRPRGAAARAVPLASA